jgi:hypothetical protein
VQSTAPFTMLAGAGFQGWHTQQGRPRRDGPYWLGYAHSSSEEPFAKTL